MNKFWLVVVVLAGLAGNAGNAVAQDVCTTANQRGCFEVVVVNGAWDHQHPLTKGFDKLTRDSAEHGRRAELHPVIYQAVITGIIKPSTLPYVDVYYWNVNANVVPAVWYTKLGGEVVRGDFEDFSPQIDNMPWQEAVIEAYDKPQKAYRISFPEGVVAVSVQYPWSALSETTRVLSCPPVGAKNVVYPHHQNDEGEGLITNAATFKFLIDEKRTDQVSGVIHPFLTIPQS